MKKISPSRSELPMSKEADSLFKDLGTDTTSAIRMFLTQAVAYNGFPFEIKRKAAEYDPYMPITEGEMLAKLKTSRSHVNQGKFRDADEAVSEMRKK